MGNTLCAFCSSSSSCAWARQQATWRGNPQSTGRRSYSICSQHRVMLFGHDERASNFAEVAKDQAVLLCQAERCSSATSSLLFLCLFWFWFTKRGDLTVFNWLQMKLGPNGVLASLPRWPRNRYEFLSDVPGISSFEFEIVSHRVSWCLQHFNFENVLGTPRAERIRIRTWSRGRRCRSKRNEGFAQVWTLQPRDRYLHPLVHLAGVASWSKGLTQTDGSPSVKSLCHGKRMRCPGCWNYCCKHTDRRCGLHCKRKFDGKEHLEV